MRKRLNNQKLTINYLRRRLKLGQDEKFIDRKLRG